MTEPEISLVIPAYNEEKIIGETIKSALTFLENKFSSYELIISDDGSTDGTRKIVESYGDKHIRLAGHFPNKGKGAAIRDGVLAASGKIIAYTDADLAYGLEAIGELTECLKNTGADAVIGSRKLHPQGYEDYPAIRLLASRCFGFITGTIAGFRYDTQCGIKVFKEEAAKKIFALCDTDGFAFDFEVMMIAEKLRLKIEQFPVMIINHRES